MKKYLPILILAFVVAIPVVAAPLINYQPNILPMEDSTYDLGTSTQAWRAGYFDELCLTADTCETSWPAGGSSSGGASSTIITLNDGSQQNVGVPTLDFNTSEIAVSESPADEFNISVADDITFTSATITAATTTNLSVSTAFNFLGTVFTDLSSFLFETELDTESELEGQLTDVSNVFTNNDGTLADDDLSDDDLDALQNVAAMTESNGDILYYNSSAWQRLAAGSNGEVLKLSGGLPSWGTDLNTGGGGGIGTTTPWTTGDIVEVANNSTVKSTSTLSASKIDAAIARDSELHDAVTLAGALDYLTISGQEITRNAIDLSTDVTGTLDISDRTNLTVGATGIELSSDDIALTTGYNIPLTASTTNWNDFYNTPSTRITAGTDLSWSGNTLNFNNSTGYITDYTVTEADVTQHEAALTITESQISDLSHYVDADVSSYLYGSTTRSDLYTAGTGLSWTGTTLNAEVQTSDLHDAVTLSGTPNYITLSGQDIVRNRLDIADDLNTFTSANLAGRLTNETGSGVSVFGTSPTISSPTLSSFFGTPCTGNEFLQDIGDTGAFTCTAASGGSGGGSLSTTTEKVLAGASSTVSYLLDEFMLGGSSSTTAEFLFDYASSTMEIRGNGTTSILSSGAEESVIIGEGDQNSDGGWDVGTGLEFVFKSTTATLRGVGSSAVTAITTALNWTFTGTVDFTSATVNFGSGAIDSITEIASGLKSGSDATLITGTAGTNGNLGQFNGDGDLVDSSLATADVVTGDSTDTFTNKTFDANGTGNSLSNVDLTADVINTLPVSNGGTGITSLGSGIATWWGTPTSANFLSALSDTLNLGDEASFEIPNGSDPTVNTAGEVAVNTGTSSIRFHDGTAEQQIKPEWAWGVTFASSSLAADGAYGASGTTTSYRAGFKYPVTMTEYYCETDQGTADLRVGDGTNWSATVTCTTSGATISAPANNTFTSREQIAIQIGTQTSDPNQIYFDVTARWTTD